MNNKDYTQCDRVLIYMHEFKSISTLEALRDIGVMRLGARIFELKKRGLNINSDWETITNRYGEKVKIKRYFIDETLAID